MENMIAKKIFDKAEPKRARVYRINPIAKPQCVGEKISTDYLLEKSSTLRKPDALPEITQKQPVKALTRVGSKKQISKKKLSGPIQVELPTFHLTQT